MKIEHKDLANAIRALAMDAVQAANSGHPGMPMGMADVATVLFTRFLKFDAIGLGVFTIIGATFAYNVFGLNFLAILLAGILTAVGGGILRDVFVNQSPIVFVKEFYLSASFIGIVIFSIILYFTDEIYYATIIGIILTTSLRLMGIKYNWNLPRARES